MLLLKRLGFIVFLLSLLSACASLPSHSPISEVKAYQVDDGLSLLHRYAPFFIIEEPQSQYNLIGTPAARMMDGGGEEVFVDAAQATIYIDTRSFQTAQGTYTNLVYRVHFEKVPWGFMPFYIGMGKNVGLFVIVTLNSDDQPVLITTVHSCGCYLAFVPTSYMPPAAFPEDWLKRRQSVFGESLPGIIDYEAETVSERQLMLLVRGGSHRVKDLWLARRDALAAYNPEFIRTEAMVSLTQLPLGTGVTSFYETSGPRKGYVKGSSKPWERLLMSWWAFDWRIGEDKRLGEHKGDGPVFYTSLKPWARQTSDMRNFSGFLEYWGWGL